MGWTPGGSALFSSWGIWQFSGKSPPVPALGCREEITWAVFIFLSSNHIPISVNFLLLCECGGFSYLTFIHSSPFSCISFEAQTSEYGHRWMCHKAKKIKFQGPLLVQASYKTLCLLSIFLFFKKKGPYIVSTSGLQVLNPLLSMAHLKACSTCQLQN